MPGLPAAYLERGDFGHHHPLQEQGVSAPLTTGLLSRWPCWDRCRHRLPPCPQEAPLPSSPMTSFRKIPQTCNVGGPLFRVQLSVVSSTSQTP
ncbi:hypothetical protein GJAV_G00242030 [Gymnothorax javanicus]|nr:hypothetical protein GJAV_G00242030 [Gymnothorax javanicus]